MSSDEIKPGTEPVRESDDANSGVTDVAPSAAEPVSENDDANKPAPASVSQMSEPADDPRERVAQIEQELKAADDAIVVLKNRMTDLRRERDALVARGLPGRTITQAEAHQALVASGQAQRRARGEQARAFRNLTGGGPAPSVLTPAEQRRAAQPRRI